MVLGTASGGCTNTIMPGNRRFALTNGNESRFHFRFATLALGTSLEITQVDVSFPERRGFADSSRKPERMQRELGAPIGLLKSVFSQR